MNSSPLPLPNSNRQARYQHHTFVLRAFENSQLTKYPKLTELYFNPTSHIYLNPKTFSRLCQGLRTLKDLNVLYLNFSHSRDLDDRSLHKLSLALRQLHGLTIISLNFDGTHKITGKGIAELLKTVKKNRHLKELYLDFSDCRQASEEDLQSIYSSISRLKLLKALHANLPFQFRDNDRLATTLFKLRRLNYMEDFSLNFRPWFEIRSHYVTALSRIVHRMPKLSKLHLNNLGSQFFGAISLTSLANSVRSLRHLQKLCLQFQSESSTNPGCFNLLFKAFENSPTLTDLILDFSHRSFESCKIKNMLLSLDTLANLSKLDIDCSHCHHICDYRIGKDGINNDAIQFLSQGILHLRNLSSLKLNFYQSSGIDGEGLAFLAVALKNLSSLRVFELTFNNQKVKGFIIPFFEALSSFEYLSKLFLNFANSKDIEDKDIKALAGSLGKLENLKHLDLNLSCSSKITDKSLHDLASQIGNLWPLKVLNLNFFGCQKITAKGFEYLDSQLAQLENLREKNFNFPNINKSFGSASPQEPKSPEKSDCSLF